MIMKKIYKYVQSNDIYYCLNKACRTDFRRTNRSCEYFIKKYMEAEDIISYYEFKEYKNMRCFLWLKKQ